MWPGPASDPCPADADWAGSPAFARGRSSPTGRRAAARLPPAAAPPRCVRRRGPGPAWPAPCASRPAPPRRRPQPLPLTLHGPGGDLLTGGSKFSGLGLFPLCERVARRIVPRPRRRARRGFRVRPSEDLDDVPLPAERVISGFGAKSRERGCGQRRPSSRPVPPSTSNPSLASRWASCTTLGPGHCGRRVGPGCLTSRPRSAYVHRTGSGCRPSGLGAWTRGFHHTHAPFCMALITLPGHRSPSLQLDC